MKPITVASQVVPTQQQKQLEIEAYTDADIRMMMPRDNLRARISSQPQMHAERNQEITRNARAETCNLTQQLATMQAQSS